MSRAAGAAGIQNRLHQPVPVIVWSDQCVFLDMPAGARVTIMPLVEAENADNTRRTRRTRVAHGIAPECASRCVHHT